MRTILPIVITAALASLSTVANASVTNYFNDEAGFHAAGAILQSTNFDSYGPGVTLLSGVNTFGDITVTADAVVVSADSYLHPVRNLIVNNDLASITRISIDTPNINMFGVRIGNFFQPDAQVVLQIYTNLSGLSGYGYGLYPGGASDGLEFHGFIFSPGETITKVNMSHTQEDHGFGLTDIEIGRTAAPCGRLCGGGGAVPEPSTWALLILGFGGVGVSLRTRRRLGLLRALTS